MSLSRLPSVSQGLGGDYSDILAPAVQVPSLPTTIQLNTNEVAPSIWQQTPAPIEERSPTTPVAATPGNQSTQQGVKGSTYSPYLDPTSSLGLIGPKIDTLNEYSQSGQHQLYTGADVKILIETNNSGAPDQTKRIAKQLFELHTLSISIHRETAPGRALGYINPRAHAVGTRTIAGTMIMNPFVADALYEFLQPGNMVNLSKDTTSPKVDQLPPFDVTVMFFNEAGFASFRKLYGVKMITDGEIYSVNDLMIERTISYMAMDFTPLFPSSQFANFQNPNQSDPQTASEQSGTALLAPYTPTGIVPPTPIPSGISNPASIFSE